MWNTFLQYGLPALASVAGGYLAGQSNNGGDIEYSQSPEQKAVYQQIMPLLARLSSSGMNGTTPYSIPPINMLMPSNDWYSSISPEVMAGIKAPYEDASKQLTESLGYSGGSAMGGASGTLGAAQGKFWEQAGRNIGNQAWGMTQPAYSAGWQALLQASQMPYTMVPGMMGGTYSNAVIQPDQSFNWSNALMGGLGTYGMINQYPFY